jgi:hypothetical protein
MVPDTRASAEWAVDLTVNGVTHQLRVVGRAEDLIAKFESDLNRRVPIHHRLLDEDQGTVRIDWGTVKDWAVSTPQFLRGWGPGLPAGDV